MTNEKVIRQLNDLKGIGSDYVPINEALEMDIKALDAELRWIPVSEDLPEEGGNYIVTEKVSGFDDSLDAFTRTIQGRKRG